MAGCDKKIWYPANHAGASRAREGRGKARVTEKRGKKLLCVSSVQWILHLEASRCFSFLCTYQTCKLMLFSARFILSAFNYPWCLR